MAANKVKVSKVPLAKKKKLPFGASTAGDKDYVKAKRAIEKKATRDAV